MSKRILSLVLCCAMLLTCISGLTLISSAASVVKAADLTPSAYDGSQGAYWSGSFNGFNAVGWQKGGWASWNNAKLANALGAPKDTEVTLSVSFEYYWENGAADTGTWWEIGNSTSAPEKNSILTHWASEDNMVVDQWSEFTVTRENAVLGAAGKDDLFINVGELNNSHLYIRGIKVVAKVGEDTYTALWGSYQVAKLDFSTGEAVGTNATLVSNVDSNLKKIEDLDVSGVDMVEHNQNFTFKVNGIGVTDAAAVTVEYYIPTTEEMSDNTRIGVKINNKDYTLRKGATSSNVNGDNLATDKLAACTFVVSGEDAQVLSGGTNVQITSWTVGEGTARHLYIKSISVMPASSLAVPADPGYDYYDFTNAYATNPYYPQYTQPDAYGVTALWGDNGGQMYFKTTGLDSQSKVCLKFYLADGSDATDINIDYQNTTADGWKGTNGHVQEFVDGVATYVLEDAIFQNGLNGLGSFRMNKDNAVKIRRVEIYTASDKTALQEALDNKITDFTGKTSASQAAYERLVAQAEALVNDKFALQADVDALATALANASLKDVVQIAKEDTTVSYKEYAVLNNCRDEGENIGFTNAGSYIEFEVNVLEACWYTIKTSAANGNGAAYHQELKDGDTVIGTAEVPAGKWEIYTDIELGTVYLQPGLRTLRLTFTDGGSNFKALVFVANADRPAPADKTALDAAVKAADALILSNYTAESAEAVKQALTAAKEVLANADATQEQADAAVAALNAATAALVDTRYTLSGATVSGLTADNGTIELIEVDGEYVYAWRFLSEAGKYIGIGDAADVLKDSASVKYEYDIMFETGNLNDRCFLMFGTTSGWKGVNDKQDDPYFNGFAAHGNWKPTPAVGTWGTITLENAEFDPTQLDSGCVTRLGNWVSNGYLYIRAIRVIDSTDSTKVISLTFNKAPMDPATEEDLAALRDAVENPASTEGKTTSSKAAYEAALEAGRALLAEESPLKVKVEKALKEIQNAAAALTDVLTVGTTGTTTISAANAIVTAGNGSYSAGDDCIGNTGGGTVITFEINVEEARVYDLDIMAYTGAGSSTVKLGDGTTEDVYGSFLVEGNQWGADQWPEQPYHFEVALEAGVQVITLTLTNSINLRSIALTAHPSILVFETDGLRTDHNGFNSMEFADRWAAFDLGVAEGLYNMTVTFCYASTGTPWWQIQLSGEDGNRYTEGGKYSENDGFQQNPDWLTNSNDEWKLGTVTFTGAKLGADDAWKSGLFNGTSFDFGFHINSGDTLNLYIRGVKFDITDSTGNTITKQWGSLIEEQPIEVDKTALEAAIASAAALDLTAYKEESAQALTAALEAARAVLANEEAMQEEIDAAVKALNDAVAAMEMDSWDLIVESVTTTAGLNVKKGTPVQIIAVIKNVGTKTIPAGAKYGVAFAIGTKDEGDDEEEPTISYETICWSDNYKTTDTAPELKPGDTLTLISCGGGETIGEDENAKGGYWIPDEIGDFMLRAFVNDNEADGIKNEMSRDNNTLEVALKVTEDGLNVETLTAEIAKAEELDLTQYTEASAKAVTDALAAAKAVLANADATQADVDKAAADLTAAISALVKTGVTLGDVNGDNKIDTADAVLVLQYAAKLIDGTVISTAAADVNGDNKIDTADAVLILQYAAKLIQQFPAAK